MAKLVIYTNSYPYGSAETFFEAELTYLAKRFDEILIVPGTGMGMKREVPSNVRVSKPLKIRKWSTFRLIIYGILFYNNIFKRYGFRDEAMNTPFFRQLRYIGYIALTRKNIMSVLPVGDWLHYSYWLDFSAFVIGILRKENKIGKCISRAHGYDIYDNRGEKSLAFIRRPALNNLDQVYVISNHGLEYLKKKYPGIQYKLKLARLGTSTPENQNPEPENETLTLASCSAINPNKRIGLIIDALVCFSRKYPMINVKWYHLGTGPDFDKIAASAHRLFNNTFVSPSLKGGLTNSEVYEFYVTTAIDVFINVSINEGIPVSIMEAMSFSIPVAATDVGGTSEIVNETNGLLLPPDPNPETIADIFFSIWINKKDWIAKRISAREWWAINYSSEVNYMSFTDELLSVIKTI